MVVLVDCGNTRIKWRCWDGDVRPGGAVPTARWQELFADMPHCDAMVISDVAGGEAGARIAERSRSEWGIEPRMFAAGERLAGVSNGYREPTSLGPDRWAAIVGAHIRLAGMPSVVVDAGTAVTVDLVSAKGRHLGGYIVPGKASMFEALFAFTGLPRFEIPDSILADPRPGRNTVDCCVSGIRNTVAGLVDQAKAELGMDARVVVTGGDAEWLKLKDAILEPDLVFWGLAAFYRDAVGEVPQ